MEEPAAKLYSMELMHQGQEGLYLMPDFLPPPTVFRTQIWCNFCPSDDSLNKPAKTEEEIEKKKKVYNWNVHVS